MRKTVRTLIISAIFAALAAALWFATRAPPLIVQGEVSANRVDISPRVSGRVKTLSVDVGDVVAPGLVIAELESPELMASLNLSKASLEVAIANKAVVDSTRPEIIAARQAEVDAAVADVTLAQENANRLHRLAASGTATQSQIDEASRNLDAALRQKEAAQANLQLAVVGSSKEQKALAATQVEQARAIVGQQKTDASELTIYAPINGQVTTRIAELGENFSPGAPLFSLIDLDNPWFTFNLREDLLHGLKIGDTFEVSVPALQTSSIEVKVTVINAQGQYATWRATRATGDFDLRTFEVRAVPVDPLKGLRPGMSVITDWFKSE